MRGLAVVMALLAGCGGSNSTVDGAPIVDGAIPPDLRGAPDLAEPTHDGGANLPPTPGKVICGASQCDLAAGQVCCVAASVPACAAAPCPMASESYSCDGADDCNGGACCLDLGNPPSGACDPKTPPTMTCPHGPNLCHTDAECPAATPFCCPSFEMPSGQFELASCNKSPMC